MISEDRETWLCVRQVIEHRDLRPNSFCDLYVNSNLEWFIISACGSLGDHPFTLGQLEVIMALEKENNSARIDRLALEVEPKVIEWRHDLHQNPELSHWAFR